MGKQSLKKGEVNPFPEKQTKEINYENNLK
jgi:hypothetical protein